MMPVARSDELLTMKLGDEVVIYDAKNHRAHLLNRTANLVWQNCDGKTSTAQLEALLQDSLGTAEADEVLSLTLHKLGKAGLLSNYEAPRPEAVNKSRRDALQKLKQAIIPLALLPMVKSIVAPTALAAASGNETGWKHKCCCSTGNGTMKCVEKICPKSTAFCNCSDPNNPVVVCQDI